MAGLSNVDPRHQLSVDTPPPLISKDVQGFDNSVPLSPQWLLPKLGDNKDPYPHISKHTDPEKALVGDVEELSVTEKRKDVYRPSFYAAEKGRRDRWGDEEREANSVIRRVSQREGEELSDSRKLDRWSNTASRYSGEARRFPSERWTDSGSRETAYDSHRESKWNTRWGPDDKESEKRREKRSGKDGESSHDKGAHHLTIHAKDKNNQGKDTDKEGEHHRIWRSSLAGNRGKGETNPLLPSSTNKPAPMFGHGRGKGDSGPARHIPFGTALDRSNGSHRDPHVLRYSRMKLLDICRTTDLTCYKMSSEWFQEFPSVIQADPLMPLTLTAPTAEELFVLEAIGKGDVLSSGVPLASKDGSSGKNSVDTGLLLPTKSGIVEDAAPVVSDPRDERTGHRIKDHSYYVDGASYDKCSLGMVSKVPSGESLCQSEAVATVQATKFEIHPNKAYDSSKAEANKVENIIPGMSQSARVGSLWLSNHSHAMNEDGSGSSDMGWLNARKEMPIESRNRHLDSSSYLGGDPQWQDSVNFQTESRIRRQPSETIEQEEESFVHALGQGDPSILRDKLTDRKSQQYSSPEHLSLFYKDPQGRIQGPFSGSNLIEWFDAGYFGIDLLVRLANAPADAPFSLLGDVIPQLRTRVRPPPGFGLARQNEIGELSNRGKSGGLGSNQAGVSDFDPMKNSQVIKNESKVHAENQFLESLMSGRISSASLSEGMQGYNGLAGSRPPLEQQNSLLSPYLLGRESPAILSKPDAIGEFAIPQTSINPALPLWPNFPEFQSMKSTDASIDIAKDAFDSHPNHPNSQSGFGTLPKRLLQSQFQPPLSNQFPVGVIPPENLFSSEFNQDAQRVNMLRQQYMLAQQLHSQLPLPIHPNQMELLLLMQRQQQEQQQNQLLLQQHFLSQPLSGYHSYNLNNEPSFTSPSAEVVQMHEAAAQTSIEHSRLNLPNQSINPSTHSNAADAHPSQDVGPTQTSKVDQIASIPNVASSHELPQMDEILTVASDAASNLVLADNGEGASVLGTIGEAPVAKAVEDAEQCDVKKVSEKKSRKHKNTQLKAVKAVPGQNSKTNSEFEGVEKGESLDSHDKITKVDETKVKESVVVMPSPNNQAWKTVPGQKKTMPLPEIQIEERLRAQTLSLTTDYIPEIVQTNVSAAPLATSSISSDQKYAADAAQSHSLGQQSISENSVSRQNPWNLRNISQSPDVLLYEEVLPELSGNKDNMFSEEKGTSSHTLPEMDVAIEAAIDNDDFIEAKDTRKNRKKTAKSKAVKASLPNNTAVVSVFGSTDEQTKTTHHIPQDKDLLPSPPAAPSLGDFLFWKGDQASAITSPAWSTDSIKLQKPGNLRDIFKEQDKKITKSAQQQTPIPTPTKVQQPGKGGGASSSSLLIPASSTRASSLGLGQHKTVMEDDFFWGSPLKQSKEGSRSDFPSLGKNPSGQDAKETHVKGVQGEGSSKKASSRKPAAEHSITSSPDISRSLPKEKKTTESSYSEAMDFRNWCEGEWMRLTGSNDTNFLEFCLKQPTPEAAVLLRENLVSLDHNHEFIDKLINYMQFLSPEIIETAFRSRKGLKTSGEDQPRASHETRVLSNVDAEADGVVEGSSKGKKKGKKGKKVSPALLGFNVVSSRIMIGEIQTIED